MDQGLSVAEMRIAILIVGVLVLGLIYWFGKPRKSAHAKRRTERSSARVEPTLGGTEDDSSDVMAEDEYSVESRQGELRMDQVEPAEVWPQDGAASAPSLRTPASPSPYPKAGARPPQQALDRIVSLYVIPRRAEMRFRGSELVVAAEKAGLEFGDLGIFHRMLDGKRELGPIFSAANMVKPGSFDMANIQSLESPGLSVFMTLPGPLTALDAWDTMLPATQRIAELLDGQVVDEDRNTLGRQGIAYIRDDLRAWDRRHEGDDVQLDRD